MMVISIDERREIVLSLCLAYEAPRGKIKAPFLREGLLCLDLPFSSRSAVSFGIFFAFADFGFRLLSESTFACVKLASASTRHLTGARLAEIL